MNIEVRDNKPSALNDYEGLGNNDRNILAAAHLGHPGISKRESKWEVAKRKLARGATPNAGLANVVSWDCWPLWDSLSIAAGAASATEYTFFNQPIGTGGKTKVNTNLIQVGTLPAPEVFDAHILGFSIKGDIVNADVIALFNNYYFEFWVGNRSYAEGKLELAMSQTGPYASGANATVNGPIVTSGVPTAINGMGGWDLRLPAGLTMVDPSSGQGFTTNGLTGTIIGQSQNFFVKLFGTSFTAAAAAGETLGTGVTLYVYLKGLKSRMAS